MEEATSSARGASRLSAALPVRPLKVGLLEIREKQTDLLDQVGRLTLPPPAIDAMVSEGSGSRAKVLAKCQTQFSIAKL
jgi:hypothetical protein